MQNAVQFNIIIGYLQILQGLPSSLSSLQSSRQLQERVMATECQPPLVLPRASQVEAHPKPPLFSVLLYELTNRVAPKWEVIGISLQLEPGLLDIIKTDHPSDCRACLREVLKEWMKQVDPPPSWSASVKAVKDAGNSLLARKLQEKYQ